MTDIRVACFICARDTSSKASCEFNGKIICIVCASNIMEESFKKDPKEVVIIEMRERYDQHQE